MVGGMNLGVISIQIEFKAMGLDEIPCEEIVARDKKKGRGKP